HRGQTHRSSGRDGSPPRMTASEKMVAAPLLFSPLAVVPLKIAPMMKSRSQGHSTSLCYLNKMYWLVCLGTSGTDHSWLMQYKIVKISSECSTKMLFLIESWVSRDFYHALCHLCCSCIAGYYLHYYGFLFSSLFMSLQRTLNQRFHLLVECMELLIINSFSIFQKKCNKMKITLRLVFIAVTL
ncbi:unnamed protein product, partial [Musa hybrid cultivar]